MKTRKKQVNFIKFLGITLVILSIQSLIAPAGAQDDEIAYFSISFLVSNENPDLLQVAQLIEGEMWKIGIDSRLDIRSGDDLRNRAFKTPGNPTFDEGGFDVLLYGWFDGLSAPSTLLQFFHSDHIVRNFGNFFPVNDRLLDRRLDSLSTTADFDTRTRLVEEILDQLVWDIHPMTSIYQEEELFAVNSKLSGFDPVQMRMEEVEFLDDRTELTFAGTFAASSFNPFFAQYFYDNLFSQQLFDGLLGADAAYNFHPMIAKEAPEEQSGYNRVSGRNVDKGEGLLWDIKIRPDVFWHDGYGYSNKTVSVDDVIFTYSAAINPLVRTSFSSIFQKVFGANPLLAFEKIDNETIRFHISENVRDISTLFTRLQMKWYQREFFSDRFLDLPSVFSLPILPRHILDPTYNSTGEGTGLGGLGKTADGATIPGYNDWAAFSDFNAGFRSGDFPGRAVIGTGPYQLDVINETNKYIEASAFPFYYKTVVDGEYSFKPQIFRFQYGYDKYSAEFGLVNGTIDILDSVFDVFDDLVYLQSQPSVQIQKKLGWQIYGLGYNTFSPYLGDINVRLAISHLVPRQLAVDYVLGGVSHPSFAPLPEQSPFWSERIPRIAYNLTRAWEFMEKAGYDMTDLRSQLLREEGPEETSGSIIPIASVSFAIIGRGLLKRKRRIAKE